MGTSEEKGGRNLEYFQGQKLPWLRTFLQERGTQTSSEDMGVNNGGSRPTLLKETIGGPLNISLSRARD